MLVHRKTMFGRCYCIKSFSHLKTFEKRFERVHFCFTINGAQKHDGFVGFKNACSRAKTLCHPNVTNLRSFPCTLLLMT